MAEKAKPRGAGAKQRREKPRQPKKATPKTPGRTPPQPTPPPAEDEPPPEVPEPLDVAPILEELLERVMAECALAAVARQRVPFTVSRARDAILFVAEWRFLVRDDGDPDPGDEPDPGGDPDPERDGIWREDEEPQTCPWDSWTKGAVTVVDVSVPPAQVPPEELPVTSAEAEGVPVCPDGVPDAVPALGVPLAPEQVPGEKPPCPGPSAAAAAPPAQVPVAVTALPVPAPPRPAPPVAPRLPRRDRRLSRPPRPRPAPLGPPRPPAPVPAKPSEPPAQGSQGSSGPTAEVTGQAPPPPASSPTSLGSLQQRRPSRSTGVPRLGARRGAARWVLPEVKVVDVLIEPERARPGASRARQPPPKSPQVLPGPPRVPKPEPQLCDPWLASARLAPGVTVRWGGSERRGPGAAGHGGREDGEDEAVRKAERELKPILPFPECRLSEYDE